MKPKRKSRGPQLDRGVTRRAVLMAFGAVMGKFTALQASEALLTVDLGQWKGLLFYHRGKRVFVSVDEVFDALTNGGV